MKRKDKVILGINHQFIHLQAIQDASYHRTSLASLLQDDRFDALDCWIWASEPWRSEEIRLMRDSNKHINYNIGDRFGEKVSCFASLSSSEQQYAWDTFRREADMAMAVGAKKVVIGSGPDNTQNRQAAMVAYGDFIQKACAYLPQSITLNIEPTDRDMDKYFLFGPLDESAEFVMNLRAQGVTNLAILLDMGHIPLLHEQICTAIRKLAACLGHIHLGNCIVSNRQHPLFGDKHVAWGEQDGVYQESDVAVFLADLMKTSYLKGTDRQTITFEMRPFSGQSAAASMSRFIEIFDQAWESIQDQYLDTSF